MVSPHNPFKEEENLLPDQLRLKMMQLAIGQDPRFALSAVEFTLPKPSYTIDTLTHLSQKYPDREFIILMGSDGLPTFDRWKDHELITERYHRYIYPRHGDEDLDYSMHKNITLLKDAPRFELSSTFVRQALADGKNIRHLVPDKVYNYITNNRLYQ